MQVHRQAQQLVQEIEAKGPASRNQKSVDDFAHILRERSRSPRGHPLHRLSGYALDGGGFRGGAALGGLILGNRRRR